MKIAVIKLGARITINNKSSSGGTGETINCIKLLINAGHTVDAYTNILKKDEFHDDFNIIHIFDNFKNINSLNYDALIVLNGNANFFGGKEDLLSIYNYKIINQFEGNIYYFLCDPNLMLKQIWKSVYSKSWGKKYSKDELYITRNDLRLVTQCRNTQDTLFLANKNEEFFNMCTYYPFEKFPLLTQPEYEISSVKSKEYDILYGGTFRSGKREKDMINFFFGYPEDIKVEMFGNIELKNFNENLIKEKRIPFFNKPVAYNNFGNKMSTSISTIAIGDVIYKKLDDLAQRIYESIQYGNIVFIDKSYDINMRVFKDNKLKEFCYVSDKNDVINRINQIKTNPNLYEELVYLQRNDVKFTKEESNIILDLALSD